MNASKLNRQITIQQRIVTQDAVYGTEIVRWQAITASRIWAEVQDALPSRSESVKQGLAVARNQVRVRIRYLAGIDSSMRVLVHGDRERVLQIVGGPAELGRREGMEMMCESVSS